MSLYHKLFSRCKTIVDYTPMVWAYQTAHRVCSSPAIDADGTIYFGSWDNKLYALNPDSSYKWDYETGGDI